MTDRPRQQRPSRSEALATVVLRRFKFTGPGGAATGGAGRWRPGRWRSVRGELAPGRRGLHYCLATRVAAWIDAEIWEFEDATPEEAFAHEGLMITRRGRVTRKLAWTPAAMRVVILRAADGACRTHIPGALRHAGLVDEAERLAQVRPVVDESSAVAAFDALGSAFGVAIDMEEGLPLSHPRRLHVGRARARMSWAAHALSAATRAERLPPDPALAARDVRRAVRGSSTAEEGGHNWRISRWRSSPSPRVDPEERRLIGDIATRTDMSPPSCARAAQGHSPVSLTHRTTATWSPTAMGSSTGLSSSTSRAAESPASSTGSWPARGIRRAFQGTFAALERAHRVPSTAVTLHARSRRRDRRSALS